MLRAFLLLLVCSVPARADYIHDNLRFTLFHELGHAVIDQREVKLFGPEEAAADGFALVLADRLLSAQDMASMVESITILARFEAATETFDPWSAYMPTGQRLAYAICLYHGLQPWRGGDHARALGLPPALAGPCKEIAAEIRDAWEPILAGLTPDAVSGRLRPGRGKALRLLAGDIRLINQNLGLPRDVPVTQDWCGEDNAFYYQYDERIAICSEMVEALIESAGRSLRQ
ncbi:DUF4344 domain-containing metallopeptidase [Jannaschia seohaensis]|uniref:Metallopeptidase n=1 Tax=Jannaschia seohaensis TaxID=475081 RepID=A0A2Y9A1U9_9RHOB|nr:DUF4344 domain-containing metallopeptidase [Jannaschia seohaensis]PWJ22086.1 putative metallopeptidase DUF4344 [Jannaschia seohaensis]SSA38364.1 Putative metallopeptidase [Jannaschia seohaensis]